MGKIINPSFWVAMLFHYGKCVIVSLLKITLRQKKNKMILEGVVQVGINSLQTWGRQRNWHARRAPFQTTKGWIHLIVLPGLCQLPFVTSVFEITCCYSSNCYGPMSFYYIGIAARPDLHLWRFMCWWGDLDLQILKISWLKITMPRNVLQYTFAGRLNKVDSSVKVFSMSKVRDLSVS